MKLQIVEHEYHLTTTLSGLIYLIESKFLKSGAVIKAKVDGATTTLVFYQSRDTYDLEVIYSAEDIEEYYRTFDALLTIDEIEDMLNETSYLVLEELPLSTTFVIQKSSLRNWLNDPKFKENLQVEKYKLEECISLEDLLAEVHIIIKRRNYE